MQLAILTVNDELRLDTCLMNQIKNVAHRGTSLPGAKFAIDDLRKKYPKAKHNRIHATPAYNCHGMTFAARRTQIMASVEVQKILNEDGYQAVEVGRVMPGDIIVYSKDGSIEHTGVVTWMDEGGPWVLSKWAELHEPIHRVHDCPYGDGALTTYYRKGGQNGAPSFTL